MDGWMDGWLVGWLDCVVILANNNISSDTVKTHERLIILIESCIDPTIISRYPLGISYISEIKDYGQEFILENVSQLIHVQLCITH
jgi:hypothetical protein